MFRTCWSGKSPRRHGPTLPENFRRPAPRLEPLEDRIVPAFFAPDNYLIDTGPVSVIVGDFDNNGTPDLLTVNFQAESVSALLGNGDGSFQSARSSPTAPTVIAAAEGEFTGDGRPDLAIAIQGEYPLFEDRGIAIMPGNGDGTFQAPVRISFGFFLEGGASTLSPAEAALLTMGDLNGDGHRDIVTTSPGFTSDGAVLVRLGNGDGSFQEPLDFNAGVFPRHVALADLNRDGDLDVAVTNDLSGLSSYRSTVTVLLGNGDGTLQAPVQYDVGPLLARPQMVVVGEFNGDGHPDLGALVTSVQPGSRTVVSVLLGRGDGSFQTAVLADVDGTARSVAAADLDGDGLTDLATANGYFDATVSVQINDGHWPGVAVPTVTISDVTVIEGHAGVQAVSFTVRLSAGYGQPVTVDHATADYTATAGSDYEASSGTLTFAPGEVVKTLTVRVLGDRVGERDETFYVNLSNPANAVLAEVRGAGTIVDDEPRISIDNVSRKEKNSGATLFVFTVTLSSAYDEAITISFATRDGTARAGEDYESVSGTLTFAPGETSKTITVRVKGDKKKEADESFFLDLGGAENAHFVRSWAYALILNDDRR